MIIYKAENLINGKFILARPMDVLLIDSVDI